MEQQEIFDQELDEFMGFAENPELIDPLVKDHEAATPLFVKSVAKLSSQKALVLQKIYPEDDDKHAAMFMLLLGIRIGRRLRDNERVPIHPEG